MPDVLALLTSLKEYYAAMHNKMRQTDDLYTRRYRPNINLPQGIRIHHPSTAALIVDGLRDQLRSDAPSVTFAAVGANERARSNKALMEMWGRYVLQRIGEHSATNPIHQALGDLLLRGAACIKAVFDPGLLPEPPQREDFTSETAFRRAMREWRKQRADAFPFRVRAVDPLAVYPAPGTNITPPFLIEEQTRRAYDVRHIWPRYDPDDPLAEVQWVEYWDADRYIVVIDGDVVVDRPNPYGLVPYVYAYSGLGRLPHDGDPAQLAKGVLDDITGELEAEIRLKTAIEAQALFYVFPRLLTSDDAEDIARALQAGPGAVVHLDADKVGDAAKWLESPPPNQAMFIFLQEIKQNIFRKAPTALTERPAGVDAAVHQALLIGQALKTISPVRDTLNRLGSALLNNIARIVVQLGLDMNVHGTLRDEERERMVRPSDFRAFNFSVQFEPTDPSENDRRLLAGLAVMRVPGLISKRTWREQFARGVVENSEEEEVRLAAEAVLEQLIKAGLLSAVVANRLRAALQPQQPQPEQRPAAPRQPPGSRERVVEEAAQIAPEALATAREAAQEAFTSAGIPRATPGLTT